MKFLGKTQAAFTDPEIEFENDKGAKAWDILGSWDLIPTKPICYGNLGSGQIYFFIEADMRLFYF